MQRSQLPSINGTFQPVNLPLAFHADGLAVEAEAVRRSDMVSIGMSGTLVQLLRIRRLDTPAPTR